MGYFVKVSDVENFLADEIKFILSNDSVTEEDETKISYLIDYQENRIISTLSSIYDIDSLKASSDGNLHYITMEFLRQFLYMRKRKNEAYQNKNDEYEKALETLNKILKGEIILEDVVKNTTYDPEYKSNYDDTYFYDKEVFSNKDWW